MGELLTELVLRSAELIPPGEVASYGDLAGIVGTGPRRVGAVMARDGSSVCWWRVTKASGELPAHLVDEAREHWQREGITGKANGRGCRITAHRTDLLALTDAWREATANLR